MSRQKAINEKCKQCIYDPNAPGTWRQQVHACPAGEEWCPLFPLRPRSESPLSEEKLREYHNNFSSSGD
jgi:hypothetical protein